MPLPIPPPLRPQSIVIAVKDLRARVPVAAVVALAVLVSPGLAYLVAPNPADAASTVQQSVVITPEQNFTAGAGMATFALASVRGALPPPDPRQKVAPCDTDVGEEEIGGVCWIRLAVDKCNAQKAYPHNGKCYWRALRPEKLPRNPTSGEPRPLGIADP